jgi:hypothetical protein
LAAGVEVGVVHGAGGAEGDAIGGEDGGDAVGGVGVAFNDSAG